MTDMTTGLRHIIRVHAISSDLARGSAAAVTIITGSFSAERTVHRVFDFPDIHHASLSCAHTALHSLVDDACAGDEIRVETPMGRALTRLPRRSRDITVSLGLLAGVSEIANIFADRGVALVYDTLQCEDPDILRAATRALMEERRRLAV